MKNLLLVFLGGGAGSMVRYLLGKCLNTSIDGIPYGTFAANILGSFLIGLLLGWSVKNTILTPSFTMLLATGFCGGFTTFSTFAYENHMFLKTGDLRSFALYTIASFSLGIIAVFIGMWFTK